MQGKSQEEFPLLKALLAETRSLVFAGGDKFLPFVAGGQSTSQGGNHCPCIPAFLPLNGTSHH